ncbi:MAG: hypothetical protein ACLR8Y_01160 [Alistipes indistinctus]
MHIVNIYISYLKMVRASQIVWVLAKHSFSELFAHSRLGKRRRRKTKGRYTNTSTPPPSDCG